MKHSQMKMVFTSEIHKIFVLEILRKTERKNERKQASKENNKFTR